MPSFLEKIKRIKSKLLGKGKRSSSAAALDTAPKPPVTPAMRPFSAALPSTNSTNVVPATVAEPSVRPQSEIVTSLSKFKTDSESVISSRFSENYSLSSKPCSLVLDKLTVVDPPLRSSSKRYSQALSQSSLQSPALSAGSFDNGIRHERTSSLVYQSAGDASSPSATSSQPSGGRSGAPPSLPTSKRSSMLTPMASLMYEMRRNAYIEQSDPEKAAQENASSEADENEPLRAQNPRPSSVQSGQNLVTSTFSDEINSEISSIIMADAQNHRVTFPSRNNGFDFRHTVITRQESTSLDVVVHPRPFLRRKLSTASVESNSSPNHKSHAETASGGSVLLKLPSNIRESRRSLHRGSPRSQQKQNQQQHQQLLEDFPWLQPSTGSGHLLDEQPITWIEIPSIFTRDLVARMCASAKWRQRALCITKCNGTVTVLPGSRKICIDGGTLIQRHKLLRVAQRWFRDHSGATRPSTLLLPALHEDASSIDSKSTLRRHSYDSAMSAHTSTTSLSGITPPSTPPLTRDEREFMKQASIFVNYDYVHM